MLEFSKKIIDKCSDDLSMDVKNLPNVWLKNFISAQSLIRKQSKAIKHILFCFWNL